MDIKSVFWNFFHLGVYMMATKMWTVIKNTDLACSWIFDFYLKMTRSKKIYRIYKPNFNTPLPRAFFGVTRTTLFFHVSQGQPELVYMLKFVCDEKSMRTPLKSWKFSLGVSFPRSHMESPKGVKIGVWKGFRKWVSHPNFEIFSLL